MVCAQVQTRRVVGCANTEFILLNSSGCCRLRCPPVRRYLPLRKQLAAERGARPDAVRTLPIKTVAACVQSAGGRSCCRPVPSPPRSGRTPSGRRRAQRGALVSSAGRKVTPSSRARRGAAGGGGGRSARCPLAAHCSGSAPAGPAGSRPPAVGLGGSLSDCRPSPPVTELSPLLPRSLAAGSDDGSVTIRPSSDGGPSPHPSPGAAPPQAATTPEPRSLTSVGPSAPNPVTTGGRSLGCSEEQCLFCLEQTTSPRLATRQGTPVVVDQTAGLGSAPGAAAGCPSFDLAPRRGEVTPVPFL